LELPAELGCRGNCDAFMQHWDAEKQLEAPSLARALYNTFWREILQVAAIKALWGAVLIFTAFYLVRSLVAFMGNKQALIDVGWGLSFGFFAACIVMSISLQQLNHQGSMTGTRTAYGRQIGVDVPRVEWACACCE
jgi:hypothetical protein